VPHRPIAVPPQHYQQHQPTIQPYPLNPPSAPASIEPPAAPAKGRGKSAPAPRAAEPVERPVSAPVLDPDARSQIASILDTNGRDVLGRRPLSEEQPSNGHDVIGRRPALSNQRVAETQRMIAEAMAVGEDVQPEMVMDWVQRQFGGQRPSQAWARDQILTVRSRDAVGLDADLV
jgi:hypothetical protein